MSRLGRIVTSFESASLGNAAQSIVRALMKDANSCQAASTLHESYTLQSLAQPQSYTRRSGLWYS